MSTASIQVVLPVATIKSVLLLSTAQGIGIWLMQVPMEETINQIMERYVRLNAHALSYEALKLCTCDTHEGKVFVALDMNKSLEENGVFDESLEYGEMGMEINHLIPVMDVHYTDDLTVA